MDPGRWRQIEQLYHAALERQPEERSRFVEEACRSDLELRRELKSLLAQDLWASGPLDHPILDTAASLLNHPGEVRLTAGAQLGPYRIESFIGAGGMGEVYRAKDTRLGRDVAIKLLAGHLLLNSIALARFQKEAQCIAALSHPNIVSIYDAELEHSPVFLVTEFLEGETVRQRIVRSRMHWRAAVEIATAVADGLTAAQFGRDYSPGPQTGKHFPH